TCSEGIIHKPRRSGGGKRNHSSLSRGAGQRHGLTIGEAILFFVREIAIFCRNKLKSPVK
ncbi:hypothetical protein, partial [Klebsiella quasipneumoniae]|uniref:hypothetical protein n=1 Tax=Klebsiella quasipneumoniae TaxID=1463165 RepID=UPI001C60A78D